MASGPSDAFVPASGGNHRGSAARRRPSMDWPLSREEKKRCAMQLYERDVQTANELLDSKEQALRAAKNEIKELRRASTASTTTGTRSSYADSPADHEESDVNDTPKKLLFTTPDITDNTDINNAGKGASPPAPPATSDVPAPRLSLTSQRPTSHPDLPVATGRPRLQESSGRKSSPRKTAKPFQSTLYADSGEQPRRLQRSSSLEVVSSVSSWWETAWKGDVSSGKSDAKPHVQEGGRGASPHRHGSQQRSASLEKTAASLWGSVWKGTRKVAQTVRETATILADEARTVADEVRELVPDFRNQDASTGVPNISGKQTKSVGPIEHLEWFVNFELGSPGLELEKRVKGESHTWRVTGVTKGLALDAWNAETLPVTIYLIPGRREKVVRRMVVVTGDELVAVDGEPVMPDHDLEVETDSVQHVRKCQALTFRRRIPPAATKAPAEGSADDGHE